MKIKFKSLNYKDQKKNPERYKDGSNKKTPSGRLDSPKVTKSAEDRNKI